MFKLSIFYFFLSLLLIPSNYFIFAQNNNQCLNFTGGIGEFEIIDNNEAKKFYLDTLIGKPAGWHLSKTNGVYVKLDIDRNNYYNNNFSRGSLRAKINKRANQNFNTAFRLLNSLYTDYPYISNETKNYYPKTGDVIEIKFMIKTDNPNNIKVNLIVNASTTNSILNIINRDFNLNNDWQLIIATATLPTTNSILRIDNYIYIRFNSTTQPYLGNIWLDDFRFYAYRNNNCLTIPSKPISSLKFAEINQYCSYNNCNRYNIDFIKLYLEADAWWGEEDNISLIVKYLNNNFKRVTYFLSTILLRGVHNFDYDPLYCRSWSDGNILEYIDRICIATSSSDLNNIIKRIHPTSLYPELIENTNNQNNAWPYHLRHLRIKLFSQSADIISKTFLRYYKLSQGDSLLRTDFLGFDLFEVAGYSNPILARQIYQPIFLNILKKSLASYINYFGNLGYHIYANADEPNSEGNWYTQIKFTNGYLNEKLSLNFNNNPQSIHKQFKTLIENKVYDIIISITKINFNQNCNNNDKLTNYIVSSFYLTNNKNNYYSISDESSYNTPQCYPQSLYLPLGNPLPVNSIDELVIASTSNFNNGALYKRNYENGLVLVNTSINSTFTYILSNNSEPPGYNFDIYNDQYGRRYDVSQRPIEIIISTTTGLILYSPQ
ncbi:MAG: hypothetical protein KatS3mg094_346 [Candidatus Parcubacteria bacterium]|nr:MAG: hypothetical protein KatS3mg094_346 [Candidatus Parcubacteria bacterium]